MNRSRPKFPWRDVVRVLVLLAVVSLGWSDNPAQTPEQTAVRLAPAAKTSPIEDPPVSASVANTDKEKAEGAEANKPVPQFRVERLQISSGAELMTIFGRLDGLAETGKSAPEVPLVSVLRDTLGDDNPENDRLRYVWMLTYTQPSMTKRIAAAIPFLYRRVGNKKNISGPPNPILNLAHAKRATWNRFFWWGLQNAFFDTYGMPLKASSRSYRQNLSDYRKAHVTQALSILGTYEKLEQRARDENEFLAKRVDEAPATSEINDGSTPLLDTRQAFAPGEMLELRARLLLSNNTFGGLYGPDKYESTVTSYGTKSLDVSGHNWELLRQQAESDGLYFEPLTMPDGTATHALLWISKDEVVAQNGRRFSGRFLNISNPWKDKRLKQWSGYSETRYFDAENRRTTDTHAARRVEMIPLAVYGLNHPKIPALLIDFRASMNPKKREMSLRVLNDVTNNVLSISSFGNWPYFAGRKVYSFLTGRRGIDINQPSRVRSYSELKLVLAFNSTVNPRLRDELQRRLETVSLNPMSNDMNSEIELAHKQYAALVEFARRENGLPAKVERDRREEMVSLAHGPAMRFLFGLGNIVTFGRYVHREDGSPELKQRMELARRVRYHTALLDRVVRSTPQIEVAWELPNVRASLRFLADNASAANGSAAKVAAKVFERTNDSESRTLCLDVLSRINDKTARKEMLRLFREQQPNSEWRTSVAERLRKAVSEGDRIKAADAKSVLAEIGQP
ncbi:MAG TPA: hypothetical protein VFX97_15175 [Pyrinomonadaceae bacterium]|nr:hypothetical protein [Pyrinomonadaceae bacterium]